MFFFMVSAAAHARCIRDGRLSFTLSWYTFLFPNSGLVTATFAVSTALDDDRGLAIFGCVMACALVALWVAVFAMTVRGIILRQILWPQTEEEKEEDWKASRRPTSATPGAEELGS